MLAEGIGEILSPLPVLKNVIFVIAKPNYGISTPYVYKNLFFFQKYGSYVGKSFYLCRK